MKAETIRFGQKGTLERKRFILSKLIPKKISDDLAQISGSKSCGCFGFRICLNGPAGRCLMQARFSASLGA